MRILRAEKIRLFFYYLINDILRNWDHKGINPFVDRLYIVQNDTHENSTSF